MREVTREEIKKIQLDELDYIVNICNENNIDYFLTCGTLLGAVKYNGFIPWDDDIDIGLKRTDYLRLLSILEKENNSDYRVLSIYNTSDYYYPFAKLVYTKTKVIEACREIKDLGVYIDIFPYDYYNEDYEEYMHKIRFYRNMTINRYRIKQYVPKSSNLKKKVFKTNFLWFKKFVYYMIDIISLPLGHSFWVKRYDKLVSMNDSGKYMARGCKNDPKFDEKLFSEYKDYVFENKKYKSLKNANKYLKEIYGDYKKDLPLDMQRTHHVMMAYWRDENE